MASNMAACAPMLDDPARPTDRQLRGHIGKHVAIEFGMTITSNASGVSASLAAPISTIQCSFEAGYSAEISS